MLQFARLDALTAAYIFWDVTARRLVDSNGRFEVS